MSLQVITQPAYEPVSLAAAKSWLELSDSTYDTMVRSLIKAMREHAENMTLRAYVQRSLRLTLPGWPVDPQYGNKIVLPFPPLVSVTSVQYIDSAGATQTLSASDYVVHSAFEPAFIIPAWQVAWPSTRSVPNAVQVDYVAGYPSGSPQDEAGAQENIPEKLKLWMETKLATLFENREQIITGTIVAKIPHDFTDGLLDSLIVGNRLF